jgi:hypothetical protein
MFNAVARSFMFLRARWRWVRGHCPRCNRTLYARFSHPMAGNADCPVCKDETETELRMGLWGGLAEFPAEAGVVSDPDCPPVGADR